MSCICSLKSSIAILVFFIKKNNSLLQLVQDYRTFNFMIIKNKYPLSLISKLILTPQYQIFHTNYKLFELLIIFFDMTNSSVIFQTMINDIFRDLKEKEIMIIYLNNILIFTQILKDHYKVVCKVLKVLTEYKLYLCPKKYKFDKQKIEYLRLAIS